MAGSGSVIKNQGRRERRTTWQEVPQTGQKDQNSILKKKNSEKNEKCKHEAKQQLSSFEDTKEARLIPARGDCYITPSPSGCAYEKASHLTWERV